MKVKKKLIAVCVSLTSISVFLTSFQIVTEPDSYNSRELLKNIFASASQIKTLRYHLQCEERIKGKIKHTESHVKLQVKPRKLYLYLNGPEVLWVEGENDGKALVNPDAFPYLNIYLSPYGIFLRKDQHHTIHEMGINYLVSILKEGVKKAGSNFDKHFSILGEDEINGHKCYRLSVAFPRFSWISYTVQKEETITSIARRLHVSEYMVLEKNTSKSWYDDVKEGDIIQVPTVYAKLTLLHIDKKSFLPIKSQVFDDKGLFETYEYFNLAINPTILPEEFTKQYKDYNF